jgi:hypothetical protein
VLRNPPPTPYHFLRYDDVPSDQDSPHWPHDFWSPIKFIPLDIVPGSYINFGSEDRERVEYFNTPLFGLTPRRTTAYDLHRLLFEGDLHIGDRFRTFIQFSNHQVTSASLSPGTDVDQIDLQQGFVVQSHRRDLAEAEYRAPAARETDVVQEPRSRSAAGIQLDLQG